MSAPHPTASLLTRGLPGAVIVAAALVAYHNSFSGPFVLDDVAAIVGNPTIRHFWPPGAVLSPPHDLGLPVNGRPVVNLSLALNYALSGTQVGSYHAVNLLIHALAGLALFGIVRRTLRLCPGQTRGDADARWVALAAAVIWIVHPLQTESVTYIVQRAEAMMGMFYLLTLYAFIRGAESRRWLVASVAACAVGMATKEVMVSAPVIVWLYDRTFVAGSFAEAWRRRRGYYVALASTSLLLAWLMVGTGARGGTAGFGLGVAWGKYALTQCGAIWHYLRLSVWPAPLVFDYGGAVVVKNFSEVWPQATGMAALVTGTLWALWWRPRLGFLGAWFLAILAPTSSVVPLADTIFEHRMYLPLAAVIVPVMLGLHVWRARWGLAATILLAAALAAVTVRRNDDYRSELALWRDTVAKRPGNVRAHYTLGTALFADGRTEEAIAEYRAALALKPESAPAHNDLGNALTRTGRAAEAVPHYEAALRVAPTAEAHSNLGNALVRLRRGAEARAHYELALRLQPDLAEAHNNLGNLLAQAGEFAAAEPHYEAALRARPDLADAHANLGNILAQGGHAADAVPHYEAALKLRPDFADAHFNLATALTELRRWPEAIAHYEEVLRLRPDYPGARQRLARVQAMRDVLGK